MVMVDCSVIARVIPAQDRLVHWQKTGSFVEGGFIPSKSTKNPPRDQSW